MMQIQDVIRYVVDQHFKAMLGKPGGLATLDDISHDGIYQTAWGSLTPEQQQGLLNL